MGILKYSEIDFLKNDELFPILKEVVYDRFNIKEKDDFNRSLDNEFEEVKEIWQEIYYESNGEIEVEYKKAFKSHNLFHMDSDINNSLIIFISVYSYFVDFNISKTKQHMNELNYMEESILRTKTFMNLERLNSISGVYKYLCSSKQEYIYYIENLVISDTINKELIDFLRYEGKDLIRDKYGIMISITEPLASTHLYRIEIKGHRLKNN